MNREDFTEAMVNAETAFSAGNFGLSLQWLRKALELMPDDPQALTEAGRACAALGDYRGAARYFGRAAELDPGNGDAAFNLGNACFFSGDYSRALEMYAQAEIRGVSAEVLPKLYYQTAMLCSIRQDVRAALVNFRKYEEADPTGTAGTDPEVISEKIKLYSMIEDYEKAANCAVQLIAVAPDEPKSYLVYFNLLAAQGDYDRAEQVLQDAERYASADADTAVSLKLEMAALLAARADARPDEAAADLQKAYDLLTALKQDAPAGRQDDLTLSIAEICTKQKRYDEAIRMTEALLPRDRVTEFTAAPVEPQYEEPDPAEIDAMAEADMQAIEEQLAAGEIDESLAEAAEVYYDENGNEVREYPEGMFADLPSAETPAAAPVPEEQPEAPAAPAAQHDAAFFDRVYYILVTCYAAQENYQKARNFGAMLGQSEQPYFACFGRYQEAFSVKQLAETTGEVTGEDAARHYAEAIAFCRSVMMKRPGSRFAAAFRARMYAETGKFAKAEEMANLLMPDDREAVTAYIRVCQNGQTVA